MIAHPLPPTLPVAEYLELEENSAVRHEYLDGHAYAMAGGTVDHAAIAANLVAALRPQLRGGPCRVYGSDVKVRLGPRRFVYPDVSVGCDARDRADGRAQFLVAPRLIAEVLSPATAAYDRGDKFAMYRDLASLEAYVLVATERAVVEVRTRRASGEWVAATFGPGEEVALPSIGCRVAVAAIYEDVAL